MPKRGCAGTRRAAASAGARREYASVGSSPAATAYTARASPTVSAMTDTQSSVRQAGTTPVPLSAPRVGLSPTILFSPAGTRPDPAVSVPSAKGTSPRATADADPELEPPETYAGSKLFGTAPYGDRVPTSPVANWSRLVFPMTMAPASTSRSTTVALRAGA